MPIQDNEIHLVIRPIWLCHSQSAADEFGRNSRLSCDTLKSVLESMNSSDHSHEPYTLLGLNSISVVVTETARREHLGCSEGMGDPEVEWRNSICTGERALKPTSKPSRR